MKPPSAGKEVAPPHLRCSRTDGRKWQCPGYAFGSFKVCEHHYRVRFKKKRSSLKVLIHRKEAAPATEPLHDRQARPAPSTEPPHDQQATKPPPDGRELKRRNASAPAVPAAPAATASTHDQRTFELRSRKVVVEPPPESATEPSADRRTGEVRPRRMVSEPPADRQTSESKRQRDTIPSTPDQRTMQLRPRKVGTEKNLKLLPPPVQPLKKRLQHGEEPEATTAAAVTMVTSFLPNGVKVVTPVPSQTGFGNAGPVVARPRCFDNAGEGNIFQRSCRSKFAELIPVAKPRKGLSYHIVSPMAMKRVYRSPPTKKSGSLVVRSFKLAGAWFFKEFIVDFRDSKQRTNSCLAKRVYVNQFLYGVQHQ